MPFFLKIQQWGPLECQSDHSKNKSVRRCNSGAHTIYGLEVGWMFEVDPTKKMVETAWKYSRLGTPLNDFK